MLSRKNYNAEDVFNLCRSYMNEDNISLIQEAYQYAKNAHDGQMRKSGEEYIIHPIHVAGILAELKSDPTTIMTGFLHDVVEDTPVTLEDLTEEFGEVVAQLVDGVTKLGKYKYRSKEQELAENHRKMLLAMGKDIRVILVKLADRLHNMRTIQYHKPYKQRIIAEETLEIYAPLADRLGISRIKWELEDIALRYLNPQQYYRIVHLMNANRRERESYVGNIMESIEDILEEMDIEARITGRPKHIYSIYRKMMTQKKKFDEIYDLLAVRVITPSVKDCYAILGAIHTKWKPIPGRFKDYIAMPKDNLYQSLHTTVLGPQATPIEVQIRTEEMHKVAEYGVAAHWAYKEGRTGRIENDDLNEHLAWFKDIQNYQSESSDATEFMDSVKEDLLADKVYVFTPENDVIELPAGASTLDFAYHIHTEVGNKSTGSKVNGRIVPLNYKLKNGDIVEMITSESSYGPSRDWLKYVNTSKARNRIKRFFKVRDMEKNTEEGKKRLEQGLIEEGYNVKEVLHRDRLEDVIERFNFNNVDELYSSIGFGEIRLSTIINRLTVDIEKDSDKEKEEATISELTEKQEAQPKKMKIQHEGGVIVEGADNLLLRLSRCCNPVPGDDIIGYVTRGRGISVHRRDCPNVAFETEEDEERLIEVEWEDTADQIRNYDAELEVTGYDRPGLLNEIVQVFTDTSNELSISNVNATVDAGTQLASIRLTITISNTQELLEVVEKIKNVADVYSVERVIN